MGLFDRDYMRSGRGASGGMGGMTMLWLLIGANVLTYIVAPGGSELNGRLAMKSWDFNVVQIVTATFAHANFSHIFLNMFGFWVFGSLIADRLGALRFFLLYMVGGVAGNLLFMAFLSGGEYSLLGASGAVYGVMMATAMVDPDREFVIIFLPFLPLKTRTLVVVYTAIELASQLSGGGGGVAHLAHLGGFLGGLLYMLFQAKELVRWNPLRPRRRSAGTWSAPRWSAPPPNGGFGSGFTGPVSQRELDYLLDKISRNGINALSESEMARLRQAREEMQRR